MAKQLLRNVRLWASTVDTGFTSENCFEVQVQDDLSWSQGTSTSTVELSEAGATPDRGSAEFNDSLDPVDWNFSTYIRTYIKEYDPDGTPDNGDEENHKLTTDSILWQGLSSGSAYAPHTGSNGVTTDETEMKVDFLDNAHHELLKLNFFILADKVWYKIAGVQVGEAVLSNDITAIGATAWSGQGTSFERLDSEPTDLINNATNIDCALSAPYIKNKLTVIQVEDNDSNTVYKVPITGGSITISNNITYLTPSTLSCLDVPIGSFTGAFSVEGEFTAYLDDQVGGTADLMDDLVTARKVTNSFTVSVIMGGKYAAGAPAAVLVLKNAQMRIPTPTTEDVLSVALGFKGIPSNFGSAVSDELVLGFSDNYTEAQIDAFITANT